MGMVQPLLHSMQTAGLAFHESHFRVNEIVGLAQCGQRYMALLVMPNVRAKRATTAGRQRPDGENVPRTTGRALVACRWRSA